MPRGVCTYFCVVILEIVDSCKPTFAAISCKINGFIASSPFSKNARCCSIIQVVTFNKVSELPKTDRGINGFGSTDKTQKSQLSNLYNKSGGIEITETYSDKMSKQN